MDKIGKEALILAATATLLSVSECSQTNVDSDINTNTTQEYNNTVEKTFEVGEHTFTKIYS